MIHLLFQLLIDTLVSDDTVKGYVDNRIYPMRIAEVRNPTYPCITMNVIQPDSVGGSIQKVSKMYLELRTHAVTQKDASKIYSAAQDKLHCKRIANTNYYLVTREVSDTPRVIIDPDSEPITYNAYSNFRIFATRRT